MRCETIGRATLYLADSKDILPGLSGIDAVVTDPPYGLSFMGQAWDYEVPQADLWRHAFSALKPGGHLVSFFASRTYHRGVVEIEDAGFDIRDQIMWLYGSGFPKSRNLDGEWQGWGTALKPAHEPICLARKPFKATVAANMREHGVGALNIDGCRVGKAGGTRKARSARKSETCSVGGFLNARRGQPIHGGRWPANVIHDGSDEVMAELETQSARVGMHSAGAQTLNLDKANSPSRGPVPLSPGGRGFRIGDSGSAARFFYCAKASRKDRGDGNLHPTVKPTALMAYLCRLVTPPGGTVLDPFMGSGSTGIAALKEGLSFIGIERDPEYFEIACQRLQAEAGC
ncbi:site-specific DNA-methyltransferase [Brevundimonas sp. 2R-24]|uniref:Methyltransferase n=1 Tax=Peiella sedimenti TaxID=3061083 RepID=A0ABT8SML5_9CAUL|nr:site-specific DNA-methyltransferase [Caulobacteraceae bacterium XZ-24]